MDIESVKAKILAKLDQTAGRALFVDVRDSLDYREQQLMMSALRDLKAQGIAQKQNRVVDGKPIFEVFRIGAPIPQTPPQQGGN